MVGDYPDKGADPRDPTHVEPEPELKTCEYCASLQEEELNLYHGDKLCDSCHDEVFA